MKCPFCDYEDTKVIDTRTMDDNTAVRRRRACEQCGKRFTTYERIDTLPLAVIKSNGMREVFSREKLQKGIMHACNKRPVSIKQIENIVNEIENSVMNTMKKEIESSEIGKMVVEKLKEIDEVSYVRFASVYRRFTDIGSFMDELSRLRDEKGVEGSED